MSTSSAELAERFPRLYHMANENAWEGIRRHGLLSTTALLDLFEVQGQHRRAIESEHRPASVTIEHAQHGVAVIRDQKPMSESALLTCLKGMTPREWYETLNRRVFFWLSAERLARLLSARAYRNTTHCVLTIDNAELLERHEHRVTLSPINSGSTIFNPQPRGADTFLPITEYPFERWAGRRNARDVVAELAVDYHVPDIYDFVLKAEMRRDARVLDVLHER